MNQIEATVLDITQTDIVTYINVYCGSAELRLIKFKAPDWLSKGDRVNCDFKEISVCVSKERLEKTSIENKFLARLKEVRKNESLCELTFDSDLGQVVSLITTDAYEELGLELECEATMLLRGVDIKLTPIVESLLAPTRMEYADK